MVYPQVLSNVYGVSVAFFIVTVGVSIVLAMKGRPIPLRAYGLLALLGMVTTVSALCASDYYASLGDYNSAFNHMMAGLGMGVITAIAIGAFILNPNKLPN